MENNDCIIRVNLLEESGYEPAMIGLAKSHKIPVDRAKEIANILCYKEGGHNKFLESMFVSFDVTAPRYWWQEADTYRLTTKQSESTMHTLVKEIQTLDGPEQELDYILNNFEPDSICNEQWIDLKEACVTENIALVKRKLPEGFLQSRVWVMSYKELRHINFQRFKHRLEHWPMFFNQVKQQIKYPQFLQRKVKAIGFTNVQTMEDE